MRFVAAAWRLVRPKQWSKNLLVFAALIFTRKFLEPSSVVLSLIAFAAMCAASSATYAFNDAHDADRDRLHPTKRYRPVAAGTISAQTAYAIAIALALLAIALGAMVKHTVVYGVLFYMLLQMSYNLWLKKVAIADVFVIALGFVVRAAIGATAISVTISAWLLFCTAALALLLGFGKRRQEFLTQGEERGITRHSLIQYSKPALDALVIIAACGAALCYGIYSINSRTAQAHPAMVLSTLFVVYAICRYVLLVFSNDEGGEPETLLFTDPHLLASILLFLASVTFAMMTDKFPFIE
jgi:4-hydroxybenzoate polyprenyltransferase